MAATKLDPNAPPFPCPYPLHLASPAPPPFPPAYACPTRFPFASCYADPLHRHLGFYFPVHQPSSAPVLRKGVSAAAQHGCSPHKLTAAFSGPRSAGKKRQDAAAGKPLKGPSPAVAAAAAGVAAPAQVPAVPLKPRLGQRKAERRSSQTKAPRPPKAAGPRARAAAQRARSPPPLYTRKTAECRNLRPPQFGSSTTVMIRNIPNRLRFGDMIALLDDHCARANRAAGAVVSAYDVVYLPMDFRRKGNFGYAFVNFTRAEAAHGLYYSLQRCRWNVRGSKKVIDIVSANIQGKDNLERYYRRKQLECDKDEFLPAVYPRPRDGVTAGDVAPMRLGSRVARRPTAAASCCARGTPTSDADASTAQG